MDNAHAKPIDMQQRKRAEAEIYKAAQDFNRHAHDVKAGTAYLDPATSHAHGFTWDPEVTRRHGERFADFGAITLLGGIAMDTITRLIGLHLGEAASRAISMTLGSIGAILMVLAPFTALIAFGALIIARAKSHQKFSYAFYASLTTLIIYAIYQLIWYLILR